MINEIEKETVIVGSGAAGYAAALRLIQQKDTDFVIVTENILSGTSRNTGSDKQTYYKLSLSGEDSDSVISMANDLFSGQCVDGDIALCEAALSTRAFYNLVECGVPFPYTEFGEYMGYKTDHDKRLRATSAGPYTSKYMTESFEDKILSSELCPYIYAHHQVIKVLTKQKRVCGLVCLDTNEKKFESELIIWCKNIIWATGGPAEIYKDSVYPASQLGSTGVAFYAGVKGKNLTEWQFGMASLSPRWNVSGSYMQVLPKFISTDQDGENEKEFLLDYFPTKEKMLSTIFLKGYQWPFDVEKIYEGSSIIDLLVYQETIVRGRRVFLDFRQNSKNEKIEFEKLDKEAYEYLKNAKALFGTPIERLMKMNQPAVQFYKDHSVNLRDSCLEIKICAQHNNGGLSTDSYWQTNINNFYAIGEVCGSHGVKRPGGSALNAGQVGAIRATEHIRLKNKHSVLSYGISTKEKKSIKDDLIKFLRQKDDAHGNRTYKDVWNESTKKMSKICGIIRDIDEMRQRRIELDDLLENYNSTIIKPSVSQLPMYYRLKEMLFTQKVYIESMIDYFEKGGGSRGSALYIDGFDGNILSASYKLDFLEHGDVIQEVEYKNNKIIVKWRSVRQIPKVNYFFETQWKMYRDREKLERNELKNES